MTETTMRAIAAMKMPDIVPAEIFDEPPIVEHVRPCDLLVDEAYQRNLSERSVTLIRKIVGGWDWRKFKPPVCVRVDGALHIIDGQHTAIAAASHPQITKIPVIVAPAGDAAARAAAFVGHNRDRLQVTPTQLHHSLVAAGDENAVTVAQVCARAGVTILKNSPGMGRFKPGDTMASAAIAAMVHRRHAIGARQVLEVCANARMAPVSAVVIRAVEELLFGESYRGQVAASEISTALIELGPQLERDASHLAIESRLQLWRATTVVLFRNCKRGRRGRSAAA